MIRLEQEKLHLMYPQISAEYTDRMSRMIRQLPAAKEVKQVNKTSLRTVMLVVLIILAMSTTAIALTRPAVLNWLLHTSPASPELESTAQEIHAEATADGITARITGAVYDGRQIAFSYELENSDPTQPALIALDGTIRLNGQEKKLRFWAADTIIARMVPSPHLDVLPAKRNPLPDGEWSQVLTEPLHGEVSCELTFIVYRPQKAFAYLISPDSMLRDTSITDEDALAEIADVRATLSGFDNTVIVETGPLDAAHWTAKGYTVLEGSTLHYPTDPASHLVEAARIPVRFTIDADKAIVHDFSGSAVLWEDCRAEAVQFRLSPLTTYIHVRLVPTENTKEAAQALAEKYGPFTLTDEGGAPVQYSEMDYLASFSPRVNEKDGQWRCQYWLEMPGLLHFPQSIGFTLSTGDLLRFDLVKPE